MCLTKGIWKEFQIAVKIILKKQNVNVGLVQEEWFRVL